MAFAGVVASSINGLAGRSGRIQANACKLWPGIRKGRYLGSHGCHQMEVLADGVFNGHAVITTF
jgi:hypothetical protein